MNKRIYSFSSEGFTGGKISEIGTSISEMLCSNDAVKVTVEPFKQTRSYSQNRLLWLWLDQLTQYMIVHHDLHATGEDWLDVLAARGILPTVVNPITNQPRRISTTKLNTKEFSEFLERFEMYCGKYHPNLNLVKPEDLYYQAMGY